MMADIERAEKELDFANRKIKQFEDVVKKLKVENEQLKTAKRGLAEDLQKLMAKRSDIENLQTTLMGIMSSTKKIDVDDLKLKLADSVRKGGNGRKRSSNHDIAETMKPTSDDVEAVPAWYKTLKKNIK